MFAKFICARRRLHCQRLRSSGVFFDSVLPSSGSTTYNLHPFYIATWRLCRNVVSLPSLKLFHLQLYELVKSFALAILYSSIRHLCIYIRCYDCVCSVSINPACYPVIVLFVVFTNYALFTVYSNTVYSCLWTGRTPAFVDCGCATMVFFFLFFFSLVWQAGRNDNCQFGTDDAFGWPHDPSCCFPCFGTH